MAKKGHKPEEIVAKLRQVDVLVSQGRSVADAIRAIGVTEVTYDELLDGEIYYSLREAQVVIESRRRHDNGVRPHASLGSRPPAPEVFVPAFAARPPASPRPLASAPTRHQHPSRATRWGPINCSLDPNAGHSFA